MNQKKRNAGSRNQRMRKESGISGLISTFLRGEPPEITAQKSIPFENVSYDGICKTSQGYYTKIIEFYDTNYILLDAPEKADLRTLYKKLLDFFDPKVHMQLFLFNRKVRNRSVEEQFQYTPQEDGLDALREEQADFLTSQAELGTNGIEKSKYLIFGIKSKELKDARLRLAGTEKAIIKLLEEIGTGAKVLNGYEWLQLMNEYFNQDSQNPFHFTWKDLSATCGSVKDYITPMSFDFRYSSYFKSGQMYGSSHYLSMISPEFTDEIMKEILDIDGNLTVSMHMQTVDPYQARQILKKKLTDVQGNKINNQRRAMQEGYDIDILPPDLTANEDGILRWLEGTNTRNRKMVNVTFLITCFGRTRQELKLLEQRLSGTIQMMDMNLRCLSYQQEQAFMSCAPIGYNEISISRPLDTISLSCLVPFCTHELFMSGESFYCGLNAMSNNLVMADRKQLRNSNGIILGTPGSGKSFWAKLEILNCILASRDHVIIADPQGEYRPLVDVLGGQTIRLALDSKDYINPMDIQDIHENDETALHIKSDFIITFMDTIAGAHNHLEADEKGIVDECLQVIYKEYFKNPGPDNMPILEDLYRELKQHRNPKAGHLADCLYLYVYGSQKYFNHRTNIDTANRLICFDFKNLSANLNQLGMLVVQDAVWNRVSANFENGTYTRYFCDEFHQLLREENTAAYMVDIWKKFRKWGGIPTALTQNVADFLRSDDIEGILGNSDYMVLLNQNPKDRDILVDKLGLSEEQIEYISNSESGCGLLIYDDLIIPVVNKYPENSLIYKILSTKPSDRFGEERVG